MTQIVLLIGILIIGIVILLLQLQHKSNTGDKGYNSINDSIVKFQASLDKSEKMIYSQLELNREEVNKTSKENREELSKSFKTASRIEI